ncbi:MAG: hypothetical protein U0670_22060 [Anaerolineae bacterium]
MRILGAILFFLLAVGAAIGLYLGWETLGQYTVVIYSIHLPWLTMRAVVALAIVGFAIRAVQLARAGRPRPAAPAMVPMSSVPLAQPSNPQAQNTTSPSDTYRF